MPGIIEHALGAGIGFVTKPVGMAVTAIALVGVTAGGMAVKNWWDDVQQMDETIAARDGTIITLRTNLQTSEQNAAAARVSFGQQIADLRNQIQTREQEASWQRARTVALARRIRELQNEENGPLAPVLAVALDSVRDDLRGLSPT